MSKSLRRSWGEIHAYYQTSAEHFANLKFPDFLSSAKRPEEIEEIKRMLNYLSLARQKLCAFARIALEKPLWQNLATIGTLGCICVFKDEECLVEKGYLLIGSSKPDHAIGEILIGYYNSEDFDPAKFNRFNDASTAAAYFEESLIKNKFLPNAR